MKRITLFLTTVACLILFAGCNMFPPAATGTTGTNTAADNGVYLQSLFGNALAAAATVLQNEGVQAAAVAAAQAYVHQNVTDENQAALYNQAISAAVPALANAVGSMAQKSPGVKNLKDTPAFQVIVNDAIVRYQKLSKK